VTRDKQPFIIGTLDSKLEMSVIFHQPLCSAFCLSVCCSPSKPGLFFCSHTPDRSVVYTYGCGRYGYSTSFPPYCLFLFSASPCQALLPHLRHRQLGHGDRKDCKTPRHVQALHDYCITSVACGSLWILLVCSLAPIKATGGWASGTTQSQCCSLARCSSGADNYWSFFWL